MSTQSLQRYKLTIEYDGTGFCGWQRQKSQLSIQQILEDSLMPLVKHRVVVYGSGRTDSGVHALGQVAHLDLPCDVEPYKLVGYLHHHLRSYPISILSVEKVTSDFHARFSAKQRHYLYRILNRPYPPAIDRNRVWWIARALDAKSMNEAAQHLAGRHDFSTFRDSKCQSRSPIKTITEISVYRISESGIIEMHCSAQTFLHHQIRNIIGTLYNVGIGKWSSDDFLRAFQACDRTKGGITAPPQGLFLKSVDY